MVTGPSLMSATCMSAPNSPVPTSLLMSAERVVPNKKLGFAKCALETVSGRIESHWYYSGDRINYEFTVPAGVTAEITLADGYTETVGGGSYTYSHKA